jgi:hypothetical protein
MSEAAPPEPQAAKGWPPGPYNQALARKASVVIEHDERGFYA